MQHRSWSSRVRSSTSEWTWLSSNSVNFVSLKSLSKPRLNVPDLSNSIIFSFFKEPKIMNSAPAPNPNSSQVQKHTFTFGLRPKILPLFFHRSLSFFPSANEQKGQIEEPHRATKMLSIRWWVPRDSQIGESHLSSITRKSMALACLLEKEKDVCLKTNPRGPKIFTFEFYYY